MNDSIIYLDTYVLQQDMRVRLPKCVLSNLDVTKGESMFDIFLDKKNDAIILRVHKDQDEGGPRHE